MGNKSGKSDISANSMWSKDKAMWAKDKERKACESCLVKFSYVIRKHHCRLCGEIFCGKCSKRRNQFESITIKKARVCNKCFDMKKEAKLETKSFPALVTSERTLSIDKPIINYVTSCASPNFLLKSKSLFFGKETSKLAFPVLFLCVSIIGLTSSSYYNVHWEFARALSVALLFILIRNIWEFNTTVEYQLKVRRKQEKKEVNIKESSKDVIDKQSNLKTTISDDIKKKYIMQGTKTLDEVTEMCSEHTSWEEEKSTAPNTLMWSKKTNSVKLFKVEAIVKASSQKVFDVLCDDDVQWNPTLRVCKVLEKIDQYTDIAYTCAAEALSGVVASRDFVNVRKWRKKKETIYLATSAIKYDKCSPIKGIIRGENGPGGFSIHSKGLNECVLIWIVNSDLKGWMPRKLIDQALTSVMGQFIEALRTKCS